MPLNLLDLPHKVLTDVFNFLKEPSLMRLREVNQTARQIVDDIILNTRITDVDHFVFFASNRFRLNQTDLSLSFNSPKDCSLWKICLRNVMVSLETMSFLPDRRETEVVAVMQTQEVDKCCQLLKPLIQRARIKYLSVNHCSPSAVSMFISCFEAAQYIPKVVLLSYNADLNQWLHFLQKVKATSFFCTLTLLTKDSIGIFLKLAETIDEISILADDCDSKPEMVSLVRQMLRRKCVQLHVNIRSCPLSLGDIENLVQYFHYLEKKICFTSYIDAESINSQVGVYNLDTPNVGRGQSMVFLKIICLLLLFCDLAHGFMFFGEEIQPKVKFAAKQIAPEDVGESSDYYDVDLTFSPADESQTTPDPIINTDAPPQLTTQKTMQEGDLYCGCELDKKFGMPDGWDSTQVWIDVVIILDTSEAMGEVSLVDASTLIESFIGTDDGDVLTTDTNSEFYTRIGLIAMSDKAEVLYNLNMTKSDKVSGVVHVKKGVTGINVVDAFNAAITMFNDGLKTNPDRVNTRQVIYYMTDSDPKADLRALNEFKTSQGIIIVNNFIENGDIKRPGLKDLASDGYYSSDIQDNYMATIQLFCKGGCFHAAPVGVQFSKAKSNCYNLGGGLIASIHDQNKADFVQKLIAKAAPKSDYFWIGYSKNDSGWSWEDQSANPYTNWDVQNGEPSSASVAKCAYMDTTTPGLYWGAGNCNVGFPAVCEFAPCSVGNSNC